ncbi:MAG TPA: two-component sensor histidine kinase [Bacteroidetes bacterium]|nr:two-component sensor histidine kinase [Bacteroidota bacterium]
MKIRNKISLTFILLLIFGVTAVSSYAILFIRNYLLEEGERTIKSHAEWISLTISNAWDNDVDLNKVAAIQNVSGYEIVIYDEDGGLLFASISSNIGPDPSPEILGILQSEQTVLINSPDQDRIYVFARFETRPDEHQLIRISREKELIYEPITTIRWIIYSGMFISIGLILLVSNLIARYLSRPIMELKASAQKVSEGKANSVTISDRSDEFADLAMSINSMAQQLREDNERLAKVHDKQSRFFEDITHEVRNPLHTIMASMELLESGKLDAEKQRRYIQNAKGQTERMSSLFKDLLTLQRYDSDENFIQSQWFDLQRITSHLEEIYLDEVQQKGIRFVIQKTPSRVLADAPKIEQVLDNLLSNAIKYTSDGEVKLAYEVTDKKVTITVSDTGIGIDEEHKKNLFDRFFRTDKARSRDSGGTGLGLAVVKSILDAHGSEIHVESKLGSGTKFWFQLTAK